MLYVHALHPPVRPPVCPPPPFRTHLESLHQQLLREFISAVEAGGCKFLKAYQSVAVGPSISCGLLFTAHGKCLCFAVVHARLWMCTYLTLSLGWIRQISMATEATASMWRTLEDALGPSRDEGTHLSRRLNCTSDRPKQSVESLCKFM